MGKADLRACVRAYRYIKWRIAWGPSTGKWWQPHIRMRPCRAAREAVYVALHI